jgi:hypothetical protein
MATGCSNAPSGATPLPALLGFVATHGAAGTIGS